MKCTGEEFTVCKHQIKCTGENFIVASMKQKLKDNKKEEKKIEFKRISIGEKDVITTSSAKPIIGAPSTPSTLR